MIGWICPKCGKSVNPRLDYCPCNIDNIDNKNNKSKPYNPNNEYKKSKEITETQEYNKL